MYAVSVVFYIEILQIIFIGAVSWNSDESGYQMNLRLFIES